MKAKKFSHLDDAGNARMVGIGHKENVKRMAVARGEIRLQKQTIQALKRKALPKGDVLAVSKIAGIQAAKKTSDLIPLCHPLLLSKIDLKFEIKGEGVEVTSQVECIGKTGVEMEALTAVSVALLAIYDMCKAVDKSMVIRDVVLLEKTKEPL